MTIKTLRMLLLGSAAALMAPTTVSAQSDDSSNDVMLFDEIVITGVTGRDATKFKSSVSISELTVDEIQNFGSRATAEIFRNIPGIRSEATAGDANTNITVRGIPIATGGAKYMQIWEDGLPVLEFGDIAFGTADGFIRADSSLARIEAIRGGSASTFASNSPAGIINFISKTGEEEGGSISVTRGIDYNTTRTDFEYGGPIGEGWNFHIGGFFRQGEGPRNAGFDGNSGGQIKVSLMKKFDNGYARIYVKHLNDRVITYLPMPVRATGSEGNPSIGSFPGFDVKKDTPHSIFLPTNLNIDGDGNRRLSKSDDGFRTLSTVVGGELSFDIGDTWNITDKFRYADNSGSFNSPFPAEVADAQTIANDIAGTAGFWMTGDPNTTLSYANGPNAGATITSPSSLNGNGLLMRIHLFDTKLNNFNNYANDLKVSNSFDLEDAGTVDITFGYYKSMQNIDMDWLWNTYVMEVKGNNAALIDITTAGGTVITDKGLAAYGVPFWGNCCTRSYDATYNIDAPYASLSWEYGPWNIDASGRYDYGKARGTYAGSVQSLNLDVNQDGVISTPEQSVSVIDNANAEPINYNWDFWSYSFGVNYTVNDDLALFARYSRGGRANADRLLFGPAVLPNSGAISDSGAAVDLVKQAEAGVKYRTMVAGGDLGLFVTGFYAKTEESNFELTSLRFFDRTYRAYGVEIEGAYQVGGFNINGGMTWTDAEISKDRITPMFVGNTPRRQADFIYQITPSYTYQDRYTLGVNIIGTTSSFAQDNNGLVMPGYAYVNLFANAEIIEGLVVSFNVNNLFNTFGLSESEEGDLSAGNVIRARGITGRSSTVTLKYSF